MSKFDDYNIKYINKNNKYDNIIIDKKNIYNIYFKSDNFEDLFKSSNSNSSNKLNGATQPYRQNPPQIVTQTPTLTTSSNQGRTYNANQMWSPTSAAGVVYEWNRGVIGVSYTGETLKEKLDGTVNHHADATVRIASSLGFPIPMTNAPFQAAIACNEKGLLIFQSEGDNGLVYFPSSLSQEQSDVLNTILAPRASFNFSFTHDGQVFEGQSILDVLTYAQSITISKAVAF